MSIISGRHARIHTLPFFVINWHFTEACNYRCGFCYAKYDDKPDTRELLHSPAAIEQLIGQIADGFAQNDAAREQHCEHSRLRLNIAGGEPMLYMKPFLHVLAQCRQRGIEASCITNASRLDSDVIRQIAPDLTVLGISIDSLSADTNERIGRSAKGQWPDVDHLIELLILAREINPDLKVKINTVVNRYNHDEDLTHFIRRVAPDKWKVLQVLPVLNRGFIIADADFHGFVRRHREFESIMTVEDNQAMTHSYLMIDPYGRFYQNRTGGSGYDYSDPIPDVGLETALSQIDFDSARFIGRY